jgi:hypothetical protein
MAIAKPCIQLVFKAVGKAYGVGVLRTQINAAFVIVVLVNAVLKGV